MRISLTGQVWSQLRLAEALADRHYQALKFPSRFFIPLHVKMNLFIKTWLSHSRNRILDIVLLLMAADHCLPEHILDLWKVPGSKTLLLCSGIQIQFIL